MMSKWKWRRLESTREGRSGKEAAEKIGALLIVTFAVIVSVLQQSGKTTAKPETPAGEIF